MVELNDLKYDLREHQPYSADLTPNDYYLFKHWKQFFRGMRFSSNEKAILFVVQCLEELP